jgi:hypothetical protein
MKRWAKGLAMAPVEIVLAVVQLLARIFRR